MRVAGLGEETTTSEDLKFLIARSVSGGTLDPGEAVMLSGVFHLHEQEARNVMTPIPAVVTVDISENVQTALQRCIDSGHTRLLVTEDENTDRVRGVVHNNSLARLLMTRGPDASIEPAVKPALLVPETRPLDDLLADLQRERVSMAVVIDEYGRTSGIVTVEDIIEEVVGEIADETDPAAGAVRRLANGDLYVRGHVRDQRPRRLRHGAGRRLGRLQLGRRARVRRARAAAEARRHGAGRTTTRCASSRCARTGSRRCGSATTANERAEGDADSDSEGDDGDSEPSSEES